MASFFHNVQAWTHPDCQDICPCLSIAKEDARSSNLDRRRKEAISRAMIVKVIWLALHTVVICSLFLAETKLTWAWRLPRFFYLTAYTFLCLTNLSFYLALCWANPGYLQKGVHALSLSTRKRDSKGDFAEDSDLAELGIGGLAHIDLSIGRRSSCSHKEKIRSSLDRTSTPPSLPSQTSKTEYEESLWDLPSFQQEEQGVNIRSGSGPGLTSHLPSPGEQVQPTAKDVLLPSTDLIHKSNFKKATMRTRGSSLGGAEEFNHAFKTSGERKERNSDDIQEPLLGDADKRRTVDCSTSTADRMEDVRASIERRPSKPNSPIAIRKHDRQFSWWEGPNPGRWCEFCGAWQLLRSRHCHDCSRCVRRFDHHCTWIGSCIGQDNHLLLWWYLLIQLTLLGWTLQINLQAFRLPVALTLGRTAVLLYCLVISFVMAIFVATLLTYHTYLVISAQTTFELMLGHSCSDSGPAKVPYLRHLPIDARPFSQGVFKNILDFCCGTEGKTYQVPAALSARKSTAEF